MWLPCLKQQILMAGGGTTLGGHVLRTSKREPNCFSGSLRLSWEPRTLSSLRIKNGRFRGLPGGQWLGPCTFTAEGLGSLSDWGTKLIPQGGVGKKKKKVDLEIIF